MALLIIVAVISLIIIALIVVSHNEQMAAIKKVGERLERLEAKRNEE